MSESRKIIKTKHGNAVGYLNNKSKNDIVIFVHGFTGDYHGPDNIFDKFVNQLDSKNISSFRFNLYGTHPSEGNHKDMTIQIQSEQIQEVINYINGLGFKNIHILAESMGVTAVLLNELENLKSYIFWYGAYDPKDSEFREFYIPEVYAEAKNNGFIYRFDAEIGFKYIQEVENIILYDKVKNIKIPTLLMHGDIDSDVPVYQSQTAFVNLTTEFKEIYIFKGADHCFRNEQEEAINKSIQFLEKLISR